MAGGSPVKSFMRLRLSYASLVACGDSKVKLTPVI